MWTQFWDMHSGGGQKEDVAMIFIEAPEDEAKLVFYNRFGHNPERVTCTCCGSDYSISESESLEQLTGFHRNCKYIYMKDGKEISQEEGWTFGKGKNEDVWLGYIEKQDEQHMNIRKSCHTSDDDKWGLYMTLEEYLKSGEALVIYAKDIKPEDRVGDIPEQGYVWVE